MTAPAHQALGIDRLVTIRKMTDIVIARKGENAGRKFVQAGAAEQKVGLHVGTIDREVAGVNDEVRLLLVDPGNERFPVAIEVRLDGAEVGVCNLNDPHGYAPSRVCLLAQRFFTRRIRAGRIMRGVLPGLLGSLCDKPAALQ